MLGAINVCRAYCTHTQKPQPAALCLHVSYEKRVNYNVNIPECKLKLLVCKTAGAGVIQKQAETAFLSVQCLRLAFHLGTRSSTQQSSHFISVGV